MLSEVFLFAAAVSTAAAGLPCYRPLPHYRHQPHHFQYTSIRQYPAYRQYPCYYYYPQISDTDVVSIGVEDTYHISDYGSYPSLSRSSNIANLLGSFLNEDRYSKRFYRDAQYPDDSAQGIENFGDELRESADAYNGYNGGSIF